jgi:hypothetical protein
LGEQDAELLLAPLEHLVLDQRQREVAHRRCLEAGVVEVGGVGVAELACDVLRHRPTDQPRDGVQRRVDAGGEVGRGDRGAVVGVAHALDPPDLGVGLRRPVEPVGIGRRRVAVEQAGVGQDRRPDADAEQGRVRPIVCPDPVEQLRRLADRGVVPREGVVRDEVEAGVAVQVGGDERQDGALGRDDVDVERAGACQDLEGGQEFGDLGAVRSGARR